MTVAQRECLLPVHFLFVDSAIFLPFSLVVFWSSVMCRNKKSDQKEVQLLSAKEKIIVRSTMGIVMALTISCICLLVLQFL